MEDDLEGKTLEELEQVRYRQIENPSRRQERLQKDPPFAEGPFHA